MRIVVAVLIALAASLASAPSEAQERWTRIGAVQVDPSVRDAVIALPDRVRGKALRIEVPFGALSLDAIVVGYGEGRTHLEERPINLRQGERTRPILLGTSEQAVTGVSLILAETQSGSPARSTAEAWVLTADPPPRAADLPRAEPAPARAAPAPSAPAPSAQPRAAEPARPVATPAAPQIVSLGKLKPGSVGFDTQRIAVPANAGFATLTIRNSGRAVTLESIEVKHEGGETETIALGRARLDAGQTREVALKSQKPVVEVTLKARSRIFDSAAKGETGEVEIAGAAPLPERTGTPPRKISGTRGPAAAAPPPPLPGAAPTPREEPVAGGTRGGEDLGQPRSVNGGGEKSAGGGIATLDACVGAKSCTPVPVFFGTDRAQTTVAERIGFGPDRAGTLTLGRVYVTVPKANRKAGELNLPSSWSGWLPWSSGLDATRHFTIPKSGISVFKTEEEFIAAVRAEMAAGPGSHKDHAFVYIHGYRVPWEFAAMRTAQIAYDLAPDNAPFGTAFMYSWPSGGKAADYNYDQDSARIAAPHLAAFLKMVAEKSGAKHVHVIAHSMGNFALMAALGELGGLAPQLKVDQVILAAPDIDKGEFERIAERVTRFAQGVTLYASASDYALLLSRKVRRNTPRAGDVQEPPGPALAAGVDTVDISKLSTGIFSYFDWNHDRYADSPVLLNDISALFRKGERPPSARNLNFKPQPAPPLQARFWRYTE